MKNKRHVYEGFLREVSGYEIRINIAKLKEGRYTLKIIHKNKVIKQTSFFNKNEIKNKKPNQ